MARAPGVRDADLGLVDGRAAPPRAAGVPAGDPLAWFRALRSTKGRREGERMDPPGWSRGRRHRASPSPQHTRTQSGDPVQQVAKHPLPELRTRQARRWPGQRGAWRWREVVPRSEWSASLPSPDSARPVFGFERGGSGGRGRRAWQGAGGAEMDGVSVHRPHLEERTLRPWKCSHSPRADCCRCSGCCAAWSGSPPSPATPEGEPSPAKQREQDPAIWAGAAPIPPEQSTTHVTAPTPHTPSRRCRRKRPA